MVIDLARYREHKPKRVARIMWLGVQMLSSCIPFWHLREWLLRVCGARVGWGGALYRTMKVYAPWNLVVGDLVCIGPGVEIYNKDRVEIGSNVVISQGAYLCTASHDVSSPTMALVTKPIRIGDNVWIAAKATVLPGVTIGEGAVVGACSVVAKDIPPWTIVVGNPARVVKQRVIVADA